ncbi:MAG: type 1 glutamine amidotransferase domain-containing protein [Planctomycetota bacterium]
MAKVSILLEKTFEDNELHYPRLRLAEAGHEVVVVAPNTDSDYKGKYGTVQKGDLASANAQAGDFDLIVIPGGSSPDHMRRDEHLVRLVRDAQKARIPMAGICHGPWMLCTADALRGRRCTSFFSIIDDCRNAGAEWVDEETVVDGHIITARHPDDLGSFMKAILATLAGEQAHSVKGSPKAPDWVR